MRAAITTNEREAWLAERRTGIGGSDAAAVLGLSPWRTPVQVWLDKTGKSSPEPETEAMRIGTELEDFVARRYMAETGRTVRRFNKILRRGHLLGNVDRLVIPEGEKIASHKGEIRTDTLLECKTSSREWEDGVPVYYLTQVQHYMGLDPQLMHADVACLFLGRKHFEVFSVERDNEVIDSMAKRLEDWWNEYVVTGKMPPPVCEADCRLLWSRSNPGKTVDASDEIVRELEAYKAAKAEQDAAKARADAAKDKVLAAMGDAEVLADPLTGKPLATWKSANDSSKTDWEALARSLGATDAQIAQFTEAREGTRRFLPKK